MNKKIITISTSSPEEAKKIREEFKNNKCSKDYKLNILICGKEDIKQNLSDFLAARLNKV